MERDCAQGFPKECHYSLCRSLPNFSPWRLPLTVQQVSTCKSTHPHVVFARPLSVGPECKSTEAFPPSALSYFGEHTSPLSNHIFFHLQESDNKCPHQILSSATQLNNWTFGPLPQFSYAIFHVLTFIVKCSPYT